MKRCDVRGRSDHVGYKRVVGFVVGCLAVLLAAMPSGAGTAAAKYHRDEAREVAIVAELRAMAPETVDEFVAATAAMDAGDLAIAVAKFRNVILKAPRSDAALRRLGSCLAEQGASEEGVAFQERALKIRRSSENLASLAQSLAGKRSSGKPSREILGRARTLISEALQLKPGDADDLALKAMIELQLNDVAAFRATTLALMRAAPDLMPTHYLAAISAAMDEEWGTAEREIKIAGSLGLSPDVVESFLSSGIGLRARVWWWGKMIAGATVLWLVGLVVMFVTGKMLSRATLASVERDDPNAPVSESTRKLRALYRGIVTVAGMYWYASLPFVAVIVVVTTGAIVYGFLAAGHIPIKLVLILVIGALISLYGIVRSLFVRIRDEDPGRAVTEEDAPGLWKMAREVAAEVGTRPVDEIWLTPGTDLAVYERGSMRQRMKDGARRALLLGAGVLENFEQGAFRAVLAHEYGHFAHRDTAGGDVALRVTNGMVALAVAIGKAGYAVWWNLAFQFLRLYDFLFRRISHGATRLQEVLADRIAIQRYGLEAFQTGLTHVIRRSMLFNKVAGTEIDQAVEQKRLLSNLYSLEVPADPAVLDDLDQEVAKRIGAPTTEDDTHPSPKDRFLLGGRIQCAAEYRADGYVWDLFKDPPAIMKEMTAVVAKHVAANTSVPVAGE